MLLSGFGAYIALPNASLVPERAVFYVAQGVIQLTVLVLLVLPSVRRAFRQIGPSEGQGAAV
jgi:hypothetical protein